MYCKNCGNEINDKAVFCEVCGQKMESKQTKKEAVKEGIIHKCPECGQVLGSMESHCPACGYEIRGVKNTDSIIGFVEKLERITNKGIRIEIILNFSVPNAKEDLIEFMITATSNIMNEKDKDIFDAWLIKIEQCYQKAEIVIKNEEDFEIIKNLYEKASIQAEKSNQKRKEAEIKKKKEETQPFISNIAICAGWILSLIILSILSAINVDNVGFNASQILLIFDIIVSIIIFVRMNKKRG